MANKRITDVDFIKSLNSDESFFVNKNNSIKQINKSNITFDVINGGTGADNAKDARVNLDITPANIGAAPASHTHTAEEIGAAPASHTHTAEEIGAIPSTGGTMTGTFVMDGGDIIFKEGVNYGTKAQRPVAGIKGRVFLQRVNA